MCWPKSSEFYYDNKKIVGCGRIAKATLGESATSVMRENVKREIVTHHALRITCLASRAALAARHFHPYRRAVARAASNAFPFTRYRPIVAIYPLRLKPKLDHRLWGGQRLARWLGLPEPLPDDLAEIWLVYAENPILNGPLAGKTLGEAARELGEGLLGSQSIPRYDRDFPQLAKFIDANDRLSIQVHPDDAYAHTVEAHTGFHGKTEAWYILHAEPGATLIYGLKRPSSREEFARAVAEGWLEELVHYLPVQTGDVIFVPAGTLHAINEGILLFEIQQKSDLTYRVYDYNRRGPDGKLRELHLEKALDVIRYEPPAQEKIPPIALEPDRDLLVACPYFALERHRLAQARAYATRPTSFDAWTVIEGAATVAGERLALGQSIVLPAHLGDYLIEPEGTATLLRTYYPDLDADLIGPLHRLGYSDERIAQTVKSA